MKKYVLLTAFITLAHFATAQDKLYLFTNETIQGKVEEVGVDSIQIRSSSNKKAKFIAKNKVNYILFENGDQYFVPHDIITLISGKPVFADVKDTSQAKIQYYDLRSSPTQLRELSIDKVLSLTFSNGDETHFYDRISLLSGKIIAAEVLEIRDKEILYRNLVKEKDIKTISTSEIDNIRFKNGYRQQFVQLEK